MIQKRSAGVLLPVSALPGPFGIGTLGEEARRFVDRLAEMGFSYWQVLPLGPLDGGNSPYAGDSAFAGNPLLIDFADLCERGLLTKEECTQAYYTGTPHTVDYTYAARNSRHWLMVAYSRLSSSLKAEVLAFAERAPWVKEYSLFRAVKEEKQGLPWQEWGELSVYEACVKRQGEFAEGVLFHTFVQYLFYQQWASFKAYAATKGIGIIGDIPVYVAGDSSDVWAHRQLFELNKEGFPLRVAGVPPDYFSEEGQLWGNPLYRWSQMAAEKYAWWVRRLLHALELYDYVRIDHFRGLVSYWAVPAGAKSAKEGNWEQGPGYALFEALEQAYPNAPLIAEDLGSFGEDVVRLLEETGFPGMRVVQFGFRPPEAAENSHRPHNYPVNVLAYTGTHDNNTLLGWLWEAPPAERETALAYCGYTDDRWGDGGASAPACRALIETVWRSAAALAIVPVQDMCGFGNDTRMNIPGVPEKNWRYRVVKEDLDKIDALYFKKLNHLCGR